MAAAAGASVVLVAAAARAYLPGRSMAACRRAGLAILNVMSTEDAGADAAGDGGAAPGPQVGRRRRLWPLTAVVGAVTVAIDAATKALALRGDSVDLVAGVSVRVMHNAGAAFSLGTGITPVFTLLATAVVVGIGWYSRRVASRGWAVALGLIAGGATGNLVDRLIRPPGFARGAVVDWISVDWFSTFNLADSALFFGVVLALWLSARSVSPTPVGNGA